MEIVFVVMCVVATTIVLGGGVKNIIDPVSLKYLRSFCSGATGIPKKHIKLTNTNQVRLYVERTAGKWDLILIANTKKEMLWKIEDNLTTIQGVRVLA